MKTLLTFLLIISFCKYSFSQSSSIQLRSFSDKSQLKEAEGANAEEPFALEDLPTFGLYGIGNVNTEAFESLNSSGKLSGYIRPYKGPKSFATFNFAFNVNASNVADSNLVNTFIFPDVGNTSFYANIDWSFRVGTKGAHDNYFISPFFEFANKAIRAKDTSLIFTTLSYTLGAKLQYMFVDDKDYISMAIMPFISFTNVPNEDNDAYRYLIAGDKNSTLSSSLTSFGVKVAFMYNNFQIFADLRSVKGNESKVPVQELRGFGSNIGVIFNAEVFEK